MIAFLCDNAGCSNRQESDPDHNLPKGWVKAEVTRSMGYLTSNPKKTLYFCPACAEKVLPVVKQIQ